MTETKKKTAKKQTETSKKSEKTGKTGKTIEKKITKEKKESKKKNKDTVISGVIRKSDVTLTRNSPGLDIQRIQKLIDQKPMTKKEKVIVAVYVFTSIATIIGIIRLIIM